MRRLRGRRGRRQAAIAAPLMFERPDWQLFMRPETLPQKAGCGPGQIGRIVLKEMVDNALDVSAEVTVEPLISAAGAGLPDHRSRPRHRPGRGPDAVRGQPAAAVLEAEAPAAARHAGQRFAGRDGRGRRLSTARSSSRRAATASTLQVDKPHRQDRCHRRRDGPAGHRHGGRDHAAGVQRQRTGPGQVVDRRSPAPGGNIPGRATRPGTGPTICASCSPRAPPDTTVAAIVADVFAIAVHDPSRGEGIVAGRGRGACFKTCATVAGPAPALGYVGDVVEWGYYARADGAALGAASPGTQLAAEVPFVVECWANCWRADRGDDTAGDVVELLLNRSPTSRR